MRKAALLLLLLLTGGCVADKVDASSKSLGSTSSRREKNLEDGEKQQMCSDTSIGGQAKTVCY